VALARATAPDTRLRMIVLPRGPGQPLRIELAPTDKSGVVMPASIGIDPRAGRVVSLAYRPADGGRAILSRLIRSTHTGTGFAIAWQIVLLAYGLILFVMATSGLAMRLLRPRHPAGLSTSKPKHRTTPSLPTRSRSPTDA
jgi:hypothetical protein